MNAHSQILIAIFAGIFLKLTLASGRAQVNVPSSDLRDILCLLLIYHHVTNRIFVHQEYIAHVKEKYYSYMPDEGQKDWLAKWCAAAVIMVTSASIASMASAQTSGSKSGIIASLQSDKNGEPEWILSGGWHFRNINSSSPAFTATFNMVMLNGSAPHKHSITDFKMSGSPIRKGIAR